MTQTSNIVQLARLRRLAKEQEGQNPKPRILFVDDEERILNSLKALFRLHYEVDVSLDGHHALELMKRNHYHLLVSDQRMPTMQGVELLRRARNISPNTMRILLTGFSDLAAIVGSVNDGEVYRYINKPWTNDEMHQVINDAVKIGLELEKLEPISDKPAIQEEQDSDNSLQQSGTNNIETTQGTNVKQFPIQKQPNSNETQQQDTNTGSEPLAGTVLFIDHGGLLHTTFRDADMQHCTALSARTPEEALFLMEKHEVGVIVASIDGLDRANVGFLCLLKKEHPHIVALAVARMGDAETTIGLVNSARIFRVIFHPLRANVLRHHLTAALKQVDNFQARPELLKIQQAKEVDVSSNLMSGIGNRLKTRIRSIRSLFRKNRK